jgi:hypothetical protein
MKKPMYLLLGLLLASLGACEKADPEVAIGGVVRAKINGQPWEANYISWGRLSSPVWSYPGRGTRPPQIFIVGSNGDQAKISLELIGRGQTLDGTDHIFSQRGLLNPVRGIQELRYANEFYFAEPANTQVEILSADTLTRTIEGRFSFRGYCCPGGQAERAAEVTEGYFKLIFP